MFNKVVAWMSYPFVISLGFILYYLLQSFGISGQFSTYISVIVSALLIELLETLFPHRSEWTADKEEIKNDLFFLGFIQVILPVLLSFFFAISLLSYLNSRDFTLTHIWPHSLPVYVQAVLVLLISDFFRYWLHVLHHRWGFLWRFHSVHHSPEKLYWLNVGRFHPVEKTSQFLLDSAPFIFLGVSEQVISLYFIFYALNGFFQHSNIELRLGLLNYIISGPELHRWHHSKLVKQSDRNYGNNLIIWDIIFCTHYLPRGRKVDKLGLNDRHYPRDFLSQLKRPFIKKR